MPDIKALENYQGVAFGFENLLANSAEAKKLAMMDAFGNFAVAQELFDPRFTHIDEGVHVAAQARGLSDAETIAWTLSQACIIEDEQEVEDEYVVGILEHAQQAYREVVKRGLPEITAAAMLAHAVGDRLEGRTGLVTVAPFRAVKAFLRYNHLEEAIPYSRVVAANDRLKPTDPDPDQYHEVRERLGVDEPGALLVIDSSPPALLAAKQAGATVMAVLDGQPHATWQALEADEFAPDFIDTGYNELRRQLGLRVLRAVPLP